VHRTHLVPQIKIRYLVFSRFSTLITNLINFLHFRKLKKFPSYCFFICYFQYFFEASYARTLLRIVLTIDILQYKYYTPLHYALFAHVQSFCFCIALNEGRTGQDTSSP
jgi:hypothetical protein